MTRLAPTASAASRLMIILLGLACVVDALALMTGNGGHDVLRWAGTFVIVGAGVCMAHRALSVRADRTAWLMFAAAGISWGAAEVVYEVAYAHMASPPAPSVADAMWFAYYPFTIAALGLLIRRRVGHVPTVYWLDAALGVAAVGAVAAVVTADLVDAAAGATSTLAAFVNAGYPTGDFLTLLLIVGAMILCRARISRGWALLLAAQTVIVATDSGWLIATSAGTWDESSLVNLGYGIGAILLVLAAWQPQEPPVDTIAPARWSALLLSAVFGLIALGVLVADHFAPAPLGSLLLATSAIALLIVRLAIVFRENFELLDVKERESSTDALTGLGNRRALLPDLEAAAAGGPPSVLVLYDLDGFKGYNDTFGHPAGDALLARLGNRLADTVKLLGGRAYRLGGDEFCALVELRDCTCEEIAVRAGAALRESGDGFRISASWGVAPLPCAGGSAEALRTADREMYARKHSGRPSATQQTLDVLLAAVRERTPALGDHVDGVAELAAAIAERLELAPHEVERVRLAAELHDVGKIAVPDAILDKPGPLDEEEWSFMRRHTLMGERILLAAHDLRHVAPLVRSSHERFDGGGYPDRLAGETIPIGSRIVAVCDAFDAMISKRPYSAPRTVEEALCELRRSAGTQFDPVVVAAFEQVMRERGESPAAAVSAALLR